MDPDLESMFVSMSNNLVPEVWMRRSYPSLKPLSLYVNDLVNRLAFFDVGGRIFGGFLTDFWRVFEGLLEGF